MKKVPTKVAAPLAAAKDSRIGYVMLKSPRVIAAFSHVTAPDTKGRYADGRYKITLKLRKGVGPDDAFVALVRNRVRAIAAQQNVLWGTALEMHDPIKDGDARPAAAEKGWAGYWLLTAKSNSAPKLRDTRNVPLDPKVRVFGGDEIIAAIALGPYKEAVQGKAGAGVYLNAVMLVKKNAPGDVEAMFDEEEIEGGFVNETDDPELEALIGLGNAPDKTGGLNGDFE